MQEYMDERSAMESFICNICDKKVYIDMEKDHSVACTKLQDYYKEGKKLIKNIIES